MYELKPVKLKYCKDIVTNLYEKNTYLTPYQSFVFLNVVGLGRKETNPFCCIGYHENTYVLYKDRVAIAVVPLFVNDWKKEILLRGEFSIAAHLDFAYSSKIEQEDYLFMLSQFKTIYKGYILHLNRISEKSLSYKYMLQIVEPDNLVQSVCVSIPFFDGYDSWFGGLSKSFRQDIRSGYNRLNTDRKIFSFLFDLFEFPEKKADEEMLRLYSKRACEHSKINSKLVEEALYYLKKSNPFNTALHQTKGYVGGRVYIDNILAAYCQGIISNDGRVIVPKLSIDLEYRRYNLGGLLINETIKHISKDDKLRFINQLDLSRGEEKYKYDYGGKNHINYECDIQL